MGVAQLMCFPLFRSNMDPIAAVQSAGRRRSLSNPFFQRTEEDVAKEAKADQMKDDLEKLYSSDKLPAAAGLAVALAPGEEMGEKLHSTRLWAWSGEKEKSV